MLALTMKLGHTVRGRHYTHNSGDAQCRSKSQHGHCYEHISTSLCFANRDCDSEGPLLHEIVIIVSYLKGWRQHRYCHGHRLFIRRVRK
jgi:hypothetical protein